MNNNPKLSPVIGEPPAPQDPHAELEAWARRVLPEMDGWANRSYFSVTVGTWADDLARILGRIDGEGAKS